MNHFFNDKVVVITGGNGGLGQALTEKLLSLGAKVAILDVTESDTKNDSSLIYKQVDLTNQLKVDNAIKDVLMELGSVDILINNAGITHMSLFEDTQIDTLEKIMAVNFWGSVYTTRACLTSLKKTQGHLVAISSVAGFAPLYGRSAYAAGKHALEGFVRSLASEVAEHNVKVSVICPGFVSTRPELNVAVNSGVVSPGAAKKNVRNALSPDLAANEILTSISKNKRTLYLGWLAKAANLLYKFLPRVYLAKMTQDAKKEFN